MSRSTFKVDKFDKVFPRKTDKKRRTKSKDYAKFFGYHNGDITYGYPVENRHHKTIKEHIQKEIEKEQLEELKYVETT